MLQQLWNGVSVGSLYALIGIGYTLLFGILRVVFFAQGDLSMIAAFAALGVLSGLRSEEPGPALYLWLAAAVAAALVAAVLTGLASERVALRPLRDAPRVKPLITSLGVSIILQSAIMLYAGPNAFAFALPLPLARWDVLGVTVSVVELAIITIVLVLAIGVDRYLHRTPHGLALLAASQNREGARLMGIKLDHVTREAFVISSITAALAGLALAAHYGVAKFNMGFVPGIKGFTIAIIGGLGSVRGVVIAGVLLGVCEALFAGYVSSDYRDVLVFALLVMMFVIRPHGLLGPKE